MFGSNREYLKLQNEIDKMHVRNIELARQVRDLNLENAELYRENKEVCGEKQEMIEILEEISKMSISNTYNNEKVILGKIKELSITAAKQYR